MHRALPAVPASPLERGLLVLLAAAGLALLLVLALATDPDPRGHGTHEQLGLQPCSWARVHGEPCPTCGVTTAASLLVHLQPIASFSTHPFGATLALLLAVFVVLGFVHAGRGESLVARSARWPWAWISLSLVALLLASWAWTKAHWTPL